MRLAIQCRTDQSFTSPPPRDVSAATVGGDTGMARGHGGGTRTQGVAQGCQWDKGLRLGHGAGTGTQGKRAGHGNETRTLGCHRDMGMLLGHGHVTRTQG